MDRCRSRARLERFRIKRTRIGGVYRLEFPLTPTLSHQGRGGKTQFVVKDVLSGPLPPPRGRARERGEHGLADIYLMQFDTEML